MIDYPIPLELEVSSNEAYELEWSSNEAFDLGLETAIIVNAVDADPYDGEYTITPRRENIVLSTNNKYMTDNVTILEIPYVAVSNPSGGKTYTIGGN